MLMRLVLLSRECLWWRLRSIWRMLLLTRTWLLSADTMVQLVVMLRAILWRLLEICVDGPSLPASSSLCFWTTWRLTERRRDWMWRSWWSTMFKWTMLLWWDVVPIVLMVVLDVGRREERWEVAYQRHPAHIEMMCTVKEAAVPKSTSVMCWIWEWGVGSCAVSYDQKATCHSPSCVWRRCVCLICFQWVLSVGWLICLLKEPRMCITNSFYYLVYSDNVQQIPLFEWTTRFPLSERYP